jgi:AraC-like DNA-binding protein
MTFYNQEILRIKKAVYPHDHLVEQVMRAKRFIDIHFSENIDVSRIASSAFYSKFHFIRSFKSCYGQTPHQYLRCVRIQKAKQLLKQGVTVCDACYTVGFKSTTAFSALFKKMIGYSPSALVKK